MTKKTTIDRIQIKALTVLIKKNRSPICYLYNKNVAGDRMCLVRFYLIVIQKIMRGVSSASKCVYVVQCGFFPQPRIYISIYSQFVWFVCFYLFARVYERVCVCVCVSRTRLCGKLGAMSLLSFAVQYTTASLQPLAENPECTGSARRVFCVRVLVPQYWWT